LLERSLAPVPGSGRVMEATPRSETQPPAARPGPEPTGPRDLDAEQIALLEAIASIAEGLTLYDARGQEQWTRVALTVLGEPAQASLSSAMREFTRAVAPRGWDRVGREAAQPRGAPPTREVILVGTRYRLRAVPLWPGFFASEGALLVIAERLPAELPSARCLSARFGLTAREADVAVLLAERRSNAEVAKALGISAHTARHHTGRVLLKLGARKRQDVERILRTVSPYGGRAAPEQLEPE
jgi:DNA-binding CsgD family transcriptional regulator